MLDQIRSVIAAASAVAEIPRSQAERIANQIGKRSGLGGGQIASLADDIVKRSRENASMITSLVTSEVRRQVKALGLVTKEDLRRLERKIFSAASAEDLDRAVKRIERLETKSKPAPKKKTTSKSKSSAS